MDGCCGRQKDLSAGSWSVREDARHNSQSVTGTNPTERHILVFQTLLLALGPWRCLLLPLLVRLGSFLTVAAQWSNRWRWGCGCEIGNPPVTQNPPKLLTRETKDCERILWTRGKNEFFLSSQVSCTLSSNNNRKEHQSLANLPVLHRREAGRKSEKFFLDTCLEGMQTQGKRGYWKRNVSIWRRELQSGPRAKGQEQHLNGTWHSNGWKTPSLWKISE